MNDAATFGSIERFHVLVEWVPDDEPLRHRPARHGWSMARLTLSVAGEALTAHRVADDVQRELVWYIGPLLHWLADNWVALLHEERFTWPERSGDPAARACMRAIARFAAAGAEMARNLEAAEAWYRRHGMANAAAGGLFPDIFLRRFGDDAELSWTALPPPFAPQGFVFETEEGVTRLPVDEVAQPLWQLLHWVSAKPPALETPDHQADWEALATKIDALEHLAPECLSAAAIAEKLLARVQASFHAMGREDLLASKVGSAAPFVREQAPAVAMFGGLSVDLSDADIAALRDALIAAINGGTPDQLSPLVVNVPLRDTPWQSGYDLAEDLLDRLEAGMMPPPAAFVDIRSICRDLGIGIEEKLLDTDSIRGVALAGIAFAPSILVNTRSAYNRNEQGRRFTIAHELCHILHDQSRARRLAHASGAWAAPGIEKRANAFAAWLLMPPRMLEPYLPVDGANPAGWLTRTARTMMVAESALVSHLYNLGFMDDATREALNPAQH
jgi:Zn-dependent peptidase ImmA (M78 family)